jgi:hypothetical protein
MNCNFDFPTSFQIDIDSQVTNLESLAKAILPGLSAYHKVTHLWGEIAILNAIRVCWNSCDEKWSPNKEEVSKSSLFLVYVLIYNGGRWADFEQS